MKTLNLLICMLFLVSLSSNAQLIDVKKAIKNKSVDRANQRTEDGIDKSLDAAEDGVKSLFKKDDSKESEEEESSENNNEEAESGDDEEAGQTKTTQKPVQSKLESYTKYDFVPGDQVLLFEDFSQDAIGDFPALWTTNGSGEIRTLNNYPGNWLYMNSRDNVYSLMRDLTLPDNFILEFDLVPVPEEEDGRHSGFYMSLYQGTGEYLDDGLFPGTGGAHITVTTDKWGVQGYSDDAQQMLNGDTDIAPVKLNQSNHVIIWVQKRRLRIYHSGQKALDLPTVLYQQVKFNRLRFSLWGHSGFHYITNLRITSAAPDMRSKLLTEGKLVSYGIYFDINKDVVKPESNGTLKGIAQVLTENPDVKIKIVGHTDSDGADAVNLDLSKRRAASVKNELVKTFGIDAGRIETDGKGETVPVAANDTPANKALNRRVEFIKL